MKTWITLGLVALLAAAAGYGLQRYLPVSYTHLTLPTKA